MTVAIPPTTAEEPLLRVRRLSKHYDVAPARTWRRRTDVFKALDDVSFDVRRGETLGIVGESGSGKTTCARCILRAIRPTAGRVLYRVAGASMDLAALPDRALKPLRRQMQMIFQDPFASLNPRMTVGQIVGEPLAIHRIGPKRERLDKVASMLRRVGLSPDHMHRYPHALSGGQRQRVGIARALVLEPALVVADEAVSALDVSVQAQVLELLKDLQCELGLTYVFVSHNLAVVRQICDRVAVMYKGRVVEFGPAEDVLARPRHPYTRVLLSAVPHPDPDRRMQPLSVTDVSPDELSATYGTEEFDDA
jgi:ABC-type oligopeptide transport system ATPase subunit